MAPGSVQSVDWDGTIAGVAQPDGRYVFQVAAAIAGGAGARAAQASAPAPRRESFWLVHDVFPIAGPHTYGQGFGAQRSGHVARGPGRHGRLRPPARWRRRPGTVKFAGSQALAGNYVVISAADGSADYVYMHLRDPALVKKGDPVVAGQPIGFVGRTGDATACHLHFEMWPAPGWYTGGQRGRPAAEPEVLGRRGVASAAPGSPRPRQPRRAHRALHPLQALDAALQRRVGRPEAPGPALALLLDRQQMEDVAAGRHAQVLLRDQAQLAGDPPQRRGQRGGAAREGG